MSPSIKRYWFLLNIAADNRIIRMKAGKPAAQRVVLKLLQQPLTANREQHSQQQGPELPLEPERGSNRSFRSNRSEARPTHDHNASDSADNGEDRSHEDIDRARRIIHSRSSGEERCALPTIRIPERFGGDQADHPDSSWWKMGGLKRRGQRS